MATDAGGILGGVGRAIGAGGRRRPAFYGIAEVKELLGFDRTGRNGTGEGAANDEVAWIREGASVLQRNTAGGLAQDHQAEAGGAASAEWKLAPRRDSGTFAALIDAAPEVENQRVVPADC